MTLSRTSLTSISVLLTLYAIQGAWAQSSQDNVFDADEQAGGTYQFDEGFNWEPGGGPPWDDDEVDGGISFDVDDDQVYTVELSTSYSAINTLNILSRSTIHLNGTGQTLGFTENGRIETGDGALQISGIDLHLSGNMTFDYGNGDEDNPAETITVMVGTDELAFNLIINGEITDNGEAGVSGTLTFTGGGYAMLTGGIDATGTNSAFALDVENGSSLLLAGGATYNLTDGVTISYANGSDTSRMEGHGILQVADGATLSTVSTEGSSDIELSGWGALLVGSITIDEEVEDLGFESNVATDAGTGHVETRNLTLDGDSVVIVGEGGTINSTEVDHGVLTMNGSTTFLIQDGGEVTFNQLQLNNGNFINRDTATFKEDSAISGGMFTSYGNTEFQGALTMNGTLEVLGGTFTILKGGMFGNGSNTTLNSGTMNIATDIGSLTSTLNGSMLVENGGVLTIGAEAAAEEDIDSTELGQSGRLIVDGNTSEVTVNGDLNIQGELFVQNGASFTYQNNHTDSEDNVLDFGSNSMIGGGNDDDGDRSTIDLQQYHGGTTQLITNVSLFGGVIDNETGDFEAGRGILLIQLYDGGGNPDDRVDLDLRDDGTMLFALGYDSETETGYNTTIDVEGGQIRVGEGTTVSLTISGDEYIPTGTVWQLIMGDDIWDGGLWEDVELTGYNTVTRTFEHGDDGEVIVGANYYDPVGGEATALQQQRALWLQQRSEGGQLGSLLHLFDQVATLDQYQLALSAMGPTSMASALQVTADTRSFSVFREALLEMRTTDQLGRPGPARRPLGQESQSLLATQDEGDAVRSEYGYGSSPESQPSQSDGSNMIAFVQGYGRSLNLDNKGEVVGVNGNEWGVIAGVGGKIANQTVLGVLLGYDSFSGDLNDNLGHIDVGTVRVGPFVGWSDGDWNVDFAVAGGYDDYRGTRNNPGLGTAHDWRTTGWEIDVSLGAGYRIPLGGGFDLVPEGSILYSYIHTDAYQETGGVPADRLKVQPDDMNNIIGRLGLRAQIQTIPGLSFEGRLGWQGNYTFGGRVNADIGSFAVPGGTDAVNRNNLYYGLQVTYLPRWDVALTLRYEGRTLDGTNDQYIGGGVSFEF